MNKIISVPQVPTHARGRALTAGATRRLTVTLQVRHSDVTETHTMNVIISVPSYQPTQEVPTGPNGQQYYRVSTRTGTE